VDRLPYRRPALGGEVQTPILSVPQTVFANSVITYLQILSCNVCSSMTPLSAKADAPGEEFAIAVQEEYDWGSILAASYVPAFPTKV
jgi:hypothetical protein